MATVMVGVGAFAAFTSVSARHPREDLFRVIATQVLLMVVTFAVVKLAVGATGPMSRPAAANAARIAPTRPESSASTTGSAWWACVRRSSARVAASASPRASSRPSARSRWAFSAAAYPIASRATAEQSTIAASAPYPRPLEGLLLGHEQPEAALAAGEQGLQVHRRPGALQHERAQLQAEGQQVPDRVVGRVVAQRTAWHPKVVRPLRWPGAATYTEF
ncbi:hypothetical protein ABT369_09410 [Dactylosporangium sp. NPDC000244]|uniref:hypothetical protein n=1 Tax=Dactylosporangium sp. NPDC000244 TaxID=3154365 RepID=UPI0033289DD4